MAGLVTSSLIIFILTPSSRRYVVFQSEDAEELGRGLLKAFSAMSAEFPHYRQACLLISATCLGLTLVAVRLLSVGRPTFQLATLVTLGVLVSELWWSVSRIDGTGGWTPQARLTGEGVLAVVGGLLMVGGLVSWLSFAEEKNVDNGLELAVCEFEVYKDAAEQWIRCHQVSVAPTGDGVKAAESLMCVIRTHGIELCCIGWLYFVIN